MLQEAHPPAYPCGPAPTLPRSHRLASEPLLERLVLAIRSDFGCVAVIVAFLIIMISTIVFADIVTPPASNPFV